MNHDLLFSLLENWILPLCKRYVDRCKHRNTPWCNQHTRYGLLTLANITLQLIRIFNLRNKMWYMFPYKCYVQLINIIKYKVNNYEYDKKYTKLFID